MHFFKFFRVVILSTRIDISHYFSYVLPSSSQVIAVICSYKWLLDVDQPLMWLESDESMYNRLLSRGLWDFIASIIGVFKQSYTNDRVVPLSAKSDHMGLCI